MRLRPQGRLSAAGLAAVILLTACQNLQQPLGPEIGTSRMPRELARDLPAKFIVTLSEGVSVEAVAAEHGLKPDHTYRHVLNGFAGSISEAARDGLLRDSRVVHIEKDLPVQSQGGPQWGAPWGLDRIDQRSIPLDGLYNFQVTGAGVTAYIVDSGIRYTHSDFEGRARFGYDYDGGDGSDCYGHGTHVAGTVGGRTYGVAKGVALVSVKVLNCSGFGSVSGILAGFEWIIINHTKPAIVNVSLGANASVSLDAGVSSLINAGVVAVVAAGNAGADACDYSPARVKPAITVGATSITDSRAPFSNYGRCVDVFAPGDAVLSAFIGSDTDARLWSGTSMATPHATGVGALYLESAPGATPAQVEGTLNAWSTKDAVKNALSRSAHLLYSAATSGGNAPPAAQFTYSCDGLTCRFVDASTDADGTVVAWKWDFGTGAESTEKNPTYSFPAEGTRTVSLTVKDDKGATSTTAKSVTVPAGGATGIQLKAASSKQKGQYAVELSWSGANGDRIDVYRDDARIGTVANSGSFTDSPEGKGRATFRYRVCESGTQSCSAEVTVTF